MSGRAGGLTDALWRLPMLPTKVLHEGTHLLAALPWASEVSAHVRPRSGEAHVDATLVADRPAWARRVVTLAPTLVGCLLGLLVIVWWLLDGFSLPETVVGWGRLAIACILWGHYSAPSVADLRGGVVPDE